MVGHHLAAYSSISSIKLIDWKSEEANLFKSNAQNRRVVSKMVHNYMIKACALCAHLNINVGNRFGMRVLHLNWNKIKKRKNV